MIRAIFKIYGADYRPVNWPVKHPYWCPGCGDDYANVVTYADDVEELLDNWPDAYDIKYENVTRYVFTSRFQKPEWFKREGK